MRRSISVHLAPHGFAATHDRVEPGAAGACLFRLQPVPFGLPPLALLALASLADRIGTGAQFAGRARSHGGSSRRGLLAIPNERPKLVSHMRIAVDHASKQRRFLTIRQIGKCTTDDIR
ncbi:hypothetical protein [Mesorhizobium sp.]|uniref:hypothetical protein n=1 Tax=Mesorhizobium sp. TaxID=1871066 RepID=UPI000FE721A8|nr:hypothetical protein [Mesorhizobium sp.]RWB03433.1 MAG: hypothetical protein EOQ33_13370 [Mesorhizobium sp.]